MYGHRPVTCRVYGMPTVVGGKPHACWKGNFLKGHQYPSFNLDAMYHELYGLSKEFLDRMGQPDPETAGLLLSVSKSIATPVEELF